MSQITLKSQPRSGWVVRMGRGAAARGKWLAFAAALGVLAVGAVGLWWAFRPEEAPTADATRVAGPSSAAARASGPSAAVLAGAKAPERANRVRVTLNLEQQKAIGLKTARVEIGPTHDVLTAPGRVAPNESKFAFITPRATGVVRSVNARIGQSVKAGDLLATIDSPEVGTARLALFTDLQLLDVAESQAEWQQTIFDGTLELLARLKVGDSPEEIHNKFQNKPLGLNRQTLMTAYAQFRLADATFKRDQELHEQKLISTKIFQQVKATFEAAQATYQGLMDQMSYDAKLANTRARQALKKAETSVRADKERLRILGVKPDGTQPKVSGGKVLGVKPDGTLPVEPNSHDDARGPENILSVDSHEEPVEIKPIGAEPSQAPTPKEAPVSTYSIWAPFDGTILDRDQVVPGVPVGLTSRLFTMANLDQVWVEAEIHENDFDLLARSQGGTVRFTSPGYPDREFEGEVIYSGGLVDEKSRTIKLLAEAENPGHLLKPGMYVLVEVLSPRSGESALVPDAAIQAQGPRKFVFVRTAPETFERREVTVEHSGEPDVVAVSKGLKRGEEVVTEGGYKLKALAIQALSDEA